MGRHWILNRSYVAYTYVFMLSVPECSALFDPRKGPPASWPLAFMLSVPECSALFDSQGSVNGTLLTCADGHRQKGDRRPELVDGLNGIAVQRLCNLH